MERPKSQWRGQSHNGEAKVTMERPKSQWRGQSHNGEAKVTMERPKSQWRGQSHNGEAKVTMERPKSQWIGQSHNGEAKVTIAVTKLLNPLPDVTGFTNVTKVVSLSRFFVTFYIIVVKGVRQNT